MSMPVIAQGAIGPVVGPTTQAGVPETSAPGVVSAGPIGGGATTMAYASTAAGPAPAMAYHSAAPSHFVSVLPMLLTCVVALVVIGGFFVGIYLVVRLAVRHGLAQPVRGFEVEPKRP